MSKPIVVVFGTRPEAVKLAPVVEALRRRRETLVCVTAQHRQMLDQVLRIFGLEPDVDLNLMRPGQDLFDITANALLALREALGRIDPACVVVQGDTTTTFAASLAAFYLRIPVAHVEAGLRTGDKHRPFPEEINRRLTTHIAEWHFAPTPWAQDNLLREGVEASRVFITGNTGIDALLEISGRIGRGEVDPGLPPEVRAVLAKERRMILVTGHRRESFGAGFENICAALRLLAERHPDVAIVYPVHLNPNVQEPVRRHLGDLPGVVLTAPLDYVPFVALMRHAHIIVTDSGGVQEEAPSLGKPVLVMRDTTERPEGVKAGVARLVGADSGRIVDAVETLLSDPAAYAAMAQPQNPYGDGHASDRIADVLARV